MKITIGECDPAIHAETILATRNKEILNTTIVYENNPQDMDFMLNWFRERQQKGFPILGAFDEKGSLLGYASYNTFKSPTGYNHTVEHGVFVIEGQHGKGIGKMLMAELINRARQAGMHTMLAFIDDTNAESIGFHKKLGFEYCGKIKQAGRKFGRWLDVVIYQYMLEK